jgi:hypothetical protein
MPDWSDSPDAQNLSVTEDLGAGASKSEVRNMGDRPDFWKMVDRTKPSKLRVFGESELRDCLEYFSEIQSDPMLPPNEMLTASERLTLIHSEINLRQAAARHKRTQRLASWAIAVGLMSIAVAVISGIAQYFIHKSTHDNWPAVAGMPTVGTPMPSEPPTATPALTATAQIATPELNAMPTVPELTMPTPRSTTTEQRRKKRRSRSEPKRKTDTDQSIQQILRSLVRPKPTPKSGQR